MDDNTIPHRTRLVQDYLQQEAIKLLPWPVMSLEMNPREQLWDYLGRKVYARTPKWQNIQEFEKNILATVKNWWSLTYGQVYYEWVTNNWMIYESV